MMNVCIDFEQMSGKQFKLIGTTWHLKIFWDNNRSYQFCLSRYDERTKSYKFAGTR